MSYNFIEQYKDLGFVIGLGLALIVMVVGDIILYKLLNRKYNFYIILVSEILLLVSIAFFLTPLTILSAVLLSGILITILIANIGEIRIQLTAALKSKTNFNKKKGGKRRPEAIFDRDALYNKITDAVKYFSRTRTGALMTFEKDDSLKNYVDTGVKINAPVNAELLETIFYEGTRLHDGAVIINNETIVAAACYYQPSTKPVTGKMGLRHRAAMGVSEETDSVTVVVSEETGRISIAYGGDLQTVTIDEFRKTFESYMALNKREEDDAE